MSNDVPVYAEALASELPAGWRVAPFEDLVFFQEGPGIRNWQYVDQGVPFVNIRCLVDGRLDRASMSRVSTNEAFGKYRHFLLDAHDYVVSSSGTLGRIATVHEEDLPCMLNTSVIRMRPHDGHLDRRYLKYFLLSSYYQTQIKSFATGSAQLNYGPSHLRQMFIVAPPPQEQRAIASILGALDDKIEQNRRTARALEQLARAIFRAWFVGFEPVKAKAAGATSFPSMPQPVFDALPTRFVDSAMGSVPEGWEVGPFSVLVRERKERIEASPVTEAMPYVPIDCISPHQIFLREFKNGGEAKTSLVKFYPGDILFGAMRAYFHKVCMAPFEGTTRTTCFVLEPRRADDRSYSLMLASDKRTIDFATSHSVGSTIPYAKWNRSLANMPCMLATPSLRAAYGSIVDVLVLAGVDSEQQARKLAEIRDYLLPCLLNGSVRVEAAHG